jgi:hypothetical protein
MRQGRRNTPRQLTAEEVCDLLAAFIAEKNPHGATPDEAQVAELTRWINKYLVKPWDERSIRKYREADASARKERETLDEAADILRRDLRGYRRMKGIYAAAVRQRIAHLKIAIEVLGATRGWFERGMPRFADRGPDKKPWAMMAQKIAQEALAAVQAAQRMKVEKKATDAAETAQRKAISAGEDAATEAAARAFADSKRGGMRSVQKTVGAPNGPVIKFTAKFLEFIMPQGTVPAPATIWDAVTNQAKK